MDLVKIGKYIAEKRKALGLTQRQVADRLGMSDKSVSKWERGICLPDVSVYSPLCEILGISLNEFLAGEDIGQDDLQQKSEDNLLQVTADGKRRQKVLKRIIGGLLAFTGVIVLTLAGVFYRQYRPQNYVEPIDPESAEMKTAQLLAGIDGAFLYKYKVSKPFQQLTVYVSTYEKGKLISKDEIMRMHENTGIPEGGMFAIVPDFERFEVKLIATGHGSKMSTDLPILEGVKNRLYYGRSASGIDEKTQIRYNEEQGLVTLLYGENAIETIGVEAYETGEYIPENDYAYYFSFEFDL